MSKNSREKRQGQHGKRSSSHAQMVAQDRQSQQRPGAQPNPNSEAQLAELLESQQRSHSILYYPPKEQELSLSISPQAKAEMNQRLHEEEKRRRQANAERQIRLNKFDSGAISNLLFFTVFTMLLARVAGATELHQEQDEVDTSLYHFPPDSSSAATPKSGQSLQKTSDVGADDESDPAVTLHSPDLDKPASQPTKKRKLRRKKVKDDASGETSPEMPVTKLTQAQWKLLAKHQSWSELIRSIEENRITSDHLTPVAIYNLLGGPPQPEKQKVFSLLIKRKILAKHHFDYSLRGGFSLLSVMINKDWLDLVEAAAQAKLITTAHLGFTYHGDGYPSGANLVWRLSYKKAGKIILQLQDQITSDLLSAPRQGLIAGRNVLYNLLEFKLYDVIKDLAENNKITRAQLLETFVINNSPLAQLVAIGQWDILNILVENNVINLADIEAAIGKEATIKYPPLSVLCKGKQWDLLKLFIAKRQVTAAQLKCITVYDIDGPLRQLIKNSQWALIKQLVENDVINLGDLEVALGEKQRKQIHPFLSFVFMGNGI